MRVESFKTPWLSHSWWHGFEISLHSLQHQREQVIRILKVSFPWRKCWTCTCVVCVEHTCCDPVVEHKLWLAKDPAKNIMGDDSIISWCNKGNKRSGIQCDNLPNPIGLTISLSLFLTFSDTELNKLVAAAASVRPTWYAAAQAATLSNASTPCKAGSSRPLCLEKEWIEICSNHFKRHENSQSPPQPVSPAMCQQCIHPEASVPFGGAN